MPVTISGHHNSGYTLVYDEDTIATITSSGSITGTGINGALYAGYHYAWAVTNAGTVTATGGANGVQFGSSAHQSRYNFLSNQSTGLITGDAFGIAMSGQGVVSNASGGTIQGAASLAGGGVEIANFGGVYNTGVYNSGLISAPTGQAGAYGVLLPLGGTVINNLAAKIQGHIGIYLGEGANLNSPSTVTNDGTIIGGTYAVDFAPGAPTSRLIVGPSAAFTGSIAGGAGVLELAPAGSAATLDGFGVTISNFSTLAFDSTNWTVKGVAASFDNMSAITGFVAGDSIDVADFKAVTYMFASNVLTLYSAGDASQIAIPITAANGQGFNLGVYGVNGTNITECFAAGTRIATPAGETPVEDLAIGDVVLAEFAGATAVEWVGHRHVDCTRHPDPPTVWPVRVSAGAFGAGLPLRDLMLSPGHAVYVRGELIPVKHLINGLSIVQTPVDEITYYHVELAEHDLLLAEGQPAESYLDVGDRANFVNGGGAIRLYPDFGSHSCDSAAMWEMFGCTPLLSHGPRLAAVRDQVNALAGDTELPLAA
jgi:collagen type I/II/III/V/XI/XXIV/XXVII alpha